jgi:hypothetical protein
MTRLLAITAAAIFTSVFHYSDSSKMQNASFAGGKDSEPSGAVGYNDGGRPEFLMSAGQAEVVAIREDVIARVFYWPSKGRSAASMIFQTKG